MKNVLEKIRRFLDRHLGWHAHNGVFWTDGATVRSTCKYCGHAIGLDSQGNWFEMESRLLHARGEGVSEVEESPWPPKGAPESFGYTTSAKPRPGQPDLDLAQKVGQLIHGACDPKRRLDHSEVVAVYEDGSRQVVFEKKGHHRVVVEEWANRVLFDTWALGDESLSHTM
jgi:hypothetical protein